MQSCYFCLQAACCPESTLAWVLLHHLPSCLVQEHDLSYSHGVRATVWHMLRDQPGDRSSSARSCRACTPAQLACLLACLLSLHPPWASICTAMPVTCFAYVQAL